jgi:transposase
MAQNFLACDREQELLLPPSVREWLPEDHLAWFVIDAVAEMDLAAFFAAYRDDGWGRAAHDPAMMVALLVYAYAIGERSSRGIERRCLEDVATRVICANQRPDHTTIARFRQRHEAARPVPRSRPDRLKEAKRRLDEEHEVECRANADYEAYRARGRMKDGRRFGRPPNPYRPPDTPAGKINVTDPDSRNVKTSRGWVQGYNAQAVVTAEQIVIAAEVTVDSPDLLTSGADGHCRRV